MLARVRQPMLTEDLLGGRTGSLRALVVLCSALASACGGDPPPPDPPAPATISGPFALVIGAQTTLFSLAPDQGQIICSHKPGLKEFEFSGAPEAEGDAGKSLHFVLKEFDGPGSYTIEYQPGGPEHLVEVAFPAAGSAERYGYRFFQCLRLDVNITYRSHCDFSIGAEELSDRTRFQGSVSCGALWADYDSPDHLTTPLNGFADLVAKFECEQAN